MATPNAVWGIEVGQCALKAVKLRPAEEGKVELAAFDLIEHPKILSQPDADADELINAAIEKFVSRNDWQRDAFVIGVPGQQTFARFCKLPPVESKKIPEIVRFEASQQIPFDMEDVVWDYQVFQADGSPDVEVGIFAMRKDLIRRHLEFFSARGIAPLAIQTIPSALYNFCRFDSEQDVDEETAIVIIDVGAQHTDLIVVEPNSAWSRNIPVGGNSFTEALVKAFKLTFAKAEMLKRTAATSKHARQIFQAMRPVFADLVAEIQRSIGFYSSTHREVKLTRVLACGNAFNLPGLQKYLENNVTISGGVAKLEKFNAMLTSATANAPQFADNILSFAPAYGLALQGMGLGKISATLLPPELARVQAWKRKQPMFIAAAACLAIASAFPMLRTGLDKQALAGNGDTGDQAKRVVDQAKANSRAFNEASTDTTGQLEKIEKLFELQKQRLVVPRIAWLVHEAMPVVDQEITDARNADDLKKLVESDKTRFKRSERKQMVIEHLDMVYAGNIDEYKADRRAVAKGGSYGSGSSRTGGSGMSSRFGGSGAAPMARGGYRPGGSGGARSDDTGDGQPGFYVSIQGRVLYGEHQSQAVTLITEEFYPRLEELARTAGFGMHIPEKDPENTMDVNGLNLGQPIVEPFVGNLSARRVSPRGTVPGLPADAADAVANPDPATGEDMSGDWNFRLGFKIKLAEAPPAEEQEAGEPD